MAVCGTCKSETPRVRTLFTDRGGIPLKVPVDECPHCAPDGFGERFTMPSDKRLAMGWEAYPKDYEKRENPQGGYLYAEKEEATADLEARLSARPPEEIEAYNKALERRRAYGRKKPMTAVEIEQVKNRFGPQFEEEHRRVEREREEYRLAMEEELARSV